MGDNRYTAIATVLAVIVAAVTTYITTRLAGRRTDRQQADQTEISVRAKFVTELVDRVADLETRLDAAGSRERDLVDRYRADMEALDSRWRHLTNNLVLYTQHMAYLLRKQGVQVPPFTGWDKFAAEGGTVRREWVAEWDPKDRDG